ncbi:MAG: FAD-dependent oxidoreductase [Desulfomonile tiedjei]|uniref:FAD-dependent oxidoreductase n=1 Tax=Desulfomonile tiedjei TaxID=2358 RepID=A0A9D6Z3G8_9BACT|nr:FAD-dependent oxidoreductase [Desulfomonile tiedjei]
MKILEPLRIRNMEVKNRFFSAPMVRNWASPDGFVTERQIAAYTELAAGGWGLVVVEATYMRPDGNNFRQMLGMWNDRQVTGHEELTHAIHLAGAKCVLQIMHGGRCSHVASTGMQPVSSSACFPWGDNTPRELSTEEVEKLIDDYALASLRTKEAGYDATYIHAAHGFIVSQFIDPMINNRRDKYGDLMRFPTDLVKAIRAAVGPDYPIMARINGDNFMGDQSTNAERAKEYGQALEAAGVDALDISSAQFENIWYQIQPPYWKRGYLVYLAEGMKQVVNIPLGVAGRINDPNLARGIVEDGSADWVDLGRGNLADPEFPKKFIEGRPEDIRKCIACGEGCLKRLFNQHTVTCAINPRLGRERMWVMKPIAAPSKLLVVGGGLAGMEAARVAAERGFSVTLYEKDKDLGGNMALYAGMPKLHLREFINPVDWLKTQLKKLGVEVKVGTEATEQNVTAANVDKVILATGGTPFKPAIPGIDKPFVFTEDDYLMGKAKLGRKVVVLGGYWGAETAVSLTREKGVEQVTVLEESGDVGDALDFCRKVNVQAYLAEAKAVMLTEHRAIAIIDDGIRAIANGQLKDIQADTVVVSMGRVANDGLAKTLEGKVPVADLKKVGDCNRPNEQPILTAFEEANYIALNL